MTPQKKIRFALFDTELFGIYSDIKTSEQILQVFKNSKKGFGSRFTKKEQYILSDDKLFSELVVSVETRASVPRTVTIANMLADFFENITENIVYLEVYETLSKEFDFTKILARELELIDKIILGNFIPIRMVEKATPKLTLEIIIEVCVFLNRVKYGIDESLDLTNLYSQIKLKLANLYPSKTIDQNIKKLRLENEE